MAKWGQGDPRWIVEQRADATNVNNWHWTERDASSWSTDKLKALMLAVRVENEEGECEVTEVSQVEGEASINNRKGKLIFFFEWNIKLDWTGTSKSGVKFKGHVEIPNLSDENDPSEVDIHVTLAKDQPETKLMALMKKQGSERIRKAVTEYISALKTEFTEGMILPTANGLKEPEEEPKMPAKPQKSRRLHFGLSCCTIATCENSKILPVSSTSSTSSPRLSQPAGVKIPTCKISIKETFLTSPDELYRIFLTRELVQAFTHSAAVLEPDKGGKFQLLDGSVTGEFLELIPDKKIAMKWRFKSWPTGHHAAITLTFHDKSGETELQMEGVGIPSSEEAMTREGWRRHYFDAIKQTFGYGARLL